MEKYIHKDIDMNHENPMVILLLRNPTECIQSILNNNNRSDEFDRDEFQKGIESRWDHKDRNIMNINWGAFENEFCKYIDLIRCYDDLISIRTNGAMGHPGICVYYEDLINNPEETLLNVINYLGEDLELRKHNLSTLLIDLDTHINKCLKSYSGISQSFTNKNHTEIKTVNINYHRDKFDSKIKDYSFRNELEKRRKIFTFKSGSLDITDYTHLPLNGLYGDVYDEKYKEDNNKYYIDKYLSRYKLGEL